MSIAVPQVLVFQEFEITPAEIVEAMRAHISGPNAQLHRYFDADEKPLINIGPYNRTDEVCYPWPGRSAGSLVDFDYTRIFFDDALLLYHEDLIGDSSAGRGVVAPVAGFSNRIRSSTLSYKANGTNFPRSGLFNDRDVQLGDVVQIRGVVDPEDECVEIFLDTYVNGFASEPTDSSIGDCRDDTDNADTQAASTTIEQTAGANNCVTAAADGSTYDGLESGHICETYKIRVVASSIAGCAAARLQVRSASGTDDADEVEVALGAPVDIGTRGLAVTFTADTGSCSSEALEDEVAADELIFGQEWTVTVCQTFEKVCCEAGGTYAGPDNDIYVIEVTKGGLWADLPQISVTTVKGLDFSGPTEVTLDNTFVPVGSYGLAIRFVDCEGSSISSLSVGSSESAAVGLFGGDGTVAGLRTGDKFYITVTSAGQGAIQTLILGHDLPDGLLEPAAADLDLRLFIKKDIEVSRNRLSSPPLVNWEQESTQVCIKADITAFDPTWTSFGVELPMIVWSGTQFVHYREWLAALAFDVGTIASVSALDEIPGPLDEDNPLKWGVFRALQNSNGTAVKFTAVANPDDLDSWQDVVDVLGGRDDLYNVVPLTRNQEVWNLFHAYVNFESSPEAGNWKAMLINLLALSTKMIVGKSDADAQILSPTSTDGNEVLATIRDDPNATGTQFTLLRVPAANSNFITFGIRPGDIVRFLFTTDAFGTVGWREDVVDTVLSENSLLLLQGHSSAVNEPQKIEIFRNLRKSEIVDDLKQQAQAFSDRRVVAVWPDFVGTAGNTQDGFFLAAALAGLISGVVPHQGLTNVEVAGFDDFSRSTNFFTATQLDDLQDGGVWIVTEDRDGTPHTFHALTTNTLTVELREEMIRRNVDAISYLFLRRLRPFIGRTNATPSMLGKLELEIVAIIDFLKTNGFTSDLGPQLIEGEIRTLRIHPLLADRVEAVLDIQVPAPLNNLELHLVI